jgi:DNA-binding NtrC family response regulator
MRERNFALLVHDRPETFEPLKQVLRELGVETYSVSSRAQAEDLIPKCKPQVVFSDMSVVDGSWVSILNAAEASDAPLSVIVVAPHPDTKLYLSVMQRGAFDFIAPPFEREPIKFIYRSAALDTYRRREESARAATALEGLSTRSNATRLAESISWEPVGLRR